MKTKNLFAALLVLAGSALTTSAVTITAGANDLILGFYATGGTGATTNVEVDLGNVSQFYSVSSPFTVTGLNVADLSSAYGANWMNRSDLFWGVAGTTGSATGTTIGGNAIAAKTLWAGKTEATFGIQSTAWARGSTFAQQGPANTIATLYSGGLGSLNGATATANSSTAALVDNTLAGSWSKQEGNNAAAFGNFTKNLFDNATPANFGQAADLYELQPGSGAGTYIGSFGLNANGLVFAGNPADTAATTVPEPSTYAAILGAVTLGFVVVRRRVQRSAKA